MLTHSCSNSKNVQSFDFVDIFDLTQELKPRAYNSVVVDELLQVYWELDVVSRYHIIVKFIECRYSEIIHFLMKVLVDETSELIRHEAAFGIGQMGKLEAQSVLINALVNDQASIVRHEAAIALATAGDSGCMGALQEVINNEKEEKVVIESATYSLRILEQKAKRKEVAMFT